MQTNNTQEGSTCCFSSLAAEICKPSRIKVCLLSVLSFETLRCVVLTHDDIIHLCSCHIFLVPNYFFHLCFFFPPRDYPPTNHLTHTPKRKETKAGQLMCPELKLGKWLTADNSVSVFKPNIFFLVIRMNPTYLLLDKENKQEAAKPVVFIERRSVRTCLHCVGLRFLFPCNSSVCCDLISPDPCVSEEWGQQQHCGVNKFSDVIVQDY